MIRRCADITLCLSVVLFTCPALRQPCCSPVLPLASLAVYVLFACLAVCLPRCVPALLVTCWIMSSIHIILSENGLNVKYINDFIKKAHADRYFDELQSLPFYTPTLKISDKNVKPKRRVLAYGDSNTAYAFSGTSIPGEPWTPLMIELRDRVEKQTACTYNYVLMNCYPDGSSYISQHKDNESCLDATFPIVTLSFGAQRTMEFQRPNTPTTTLDLEHGSFYSMMKPTNELFTHGIPPDPSVKDMRISLTFRHLIVHPLNVKKLKFDGSPKELELPDNDWLTKLYQQSDVTTIAQWDLRWNTFVEIVMEKNFNLKIHIRNFKEGMGGELFPTKCGIVMTCATFEALQNNMSKFHFYSVKDTFISNNQLLTAFVDENFCLFQQIFKSNENSFYFKPEGLILSKDQFLRLGEFSFEISECLIDTLLTKVIPQSILNKAGLCSYSHIHIDHARGHFLTSFKHELEKSVYTVFSCYACSLGQLSQLDHDCLSTSLREKFNLSKYDALIHFNVKQFINRLGCTCHYTSTFFQCMNSEFYNKYLETIFVNEKDSLCTF